LFKGIARYSPASALTTAREFAWRCWRFLITPICIVVTLPLALLSVLLVSGMRCVACNRHIWPWQRSTDVRYTDNLDAIHEGCCTQFARDIH
jgi:hypothetical protein